MDAATRAVEVLGRLPGLVHPESADVMPDGETVLIGNCAMTLGVGAYRNGNGLVYLDGAARLSRARLDEGGLVLAEPDLVTGLTATLGLDVLRKGTRRFPSGTAFVACGGKPITRDEHTLVDDPSGVRQQALAVNPETGAVRGSIPLWHDSPIARRFNALEQPNGLALDLDGNLFVTDIPNTNPDAPLPAPVEAAVYCIPHGALDALADDDPDAAEEAARRVTRIVMPGWVNGATVSPVDGACWVVSCSDHDTARGGVYRLTAEDFEAGVLPPPSFQGLGVLDGVSVTRRGTVVVSNPRTRRIHILDDNGRDEVLVFAGHDALGNPADVNVAYPAVLGGDEPALVVPDVSVASGTNSVTVLDLSGL